MNRFIFLLTLFFYIPAQAKSSDAMGISFNFTRIVYSEKDSKGVVFKARNNNQEPLLIQAWGNHLNTDTGAIDDINNNDDVPFIVLPPLQRVEPGEDFSLHLRPNGKPIPEGKESVYLLSFKTIPVTDDKKTHRLAVTIVTSLKVFIRNHLPESGGIEEAVNKVTASWGKNGLILNNPTPYWLTLSSLRLDKHEMESSILLKMLPPGQPTFYPWDKGRPQEVTLRFIDEYSMDTPPVSLKIK